MAMNPRLLPSALLARSVLRTHSDERLTELARRGSDAAFETLVNRYRRSMVRHCDRVVGHTDAEEAVQNALLNAHHALSRGDRVHNVGPWMHAIAHNAALNILRARAARPDGVPADCEQLEHHDLSAERRQDLREVIDVLQSLPLRQRDAIVMRELEGRSYEEIAARIGSSSGAVRQLLNRARHSIRERLTVLPGLEAMVRWLGDGGGPGPVAARIGALAGGCAVTAKLCVSALVPATVMIAAPQGISAAPASRPNAHAAVTPQNPRGAQPTARYVASNTAPRARSAALTTPVRRATATRSLATSARGTRPATARPHASSTTTTVQPLSSRGSSTTATTQPAPSPQAKSSCPPNTTSPQLTQTMGPRTSSDAGPQSPQVQPAPRAQTPQTPPTSETPQTSETPRTPHAAAQ